MDCWEFPFFKVLPIIVAEGYIKLWSDFITCVKGLVERLSVAINEVHL
jgi:hypothetical protein